MIDHGQAAKHQVRHPAVSPPDQPAQRRGRTARQNQRGRLTEKPAAFLQGPVDVESLEDSTYRQAALARLAPYQP